MSKRLKKALLILLLISIPGIGLIFGWVFLGAPKPLISQKAFPDPNGYDDLAAAGKLLSRTSSTEDPATLSIEQLRELNATNAEALKRARLGLSRECAVPMTYSATSTVHIANLSSMKGIARAFVAEGRLEELEHHDDEAARSYLDVIHLSQSSARGGMLIDQLVSIAIEAIGVTHLHGLIGALDAKTCRETATALETLDAQRQPWAQVLAQEKDWAYRTYGALRYRFAQLTEGRAMKATQERTEQRCNGQIRNTRQLLVALAARAYELEKGRRPARLADLVPDYLKAVPQDPLTGKDLDYKP